MKQVKNNTEDKRLYCNLNKLYYKDYFEPVKFSLVTENNRKVLVANNVLQETNKKLLDMADGVYLKHARSLFNHARSLFNHAEISKHVFDLKVAYPGLITGIGLEHEAMVEGEFKLGIHLDYTTGLPIIYGSSVKGVLRNAFRIDNLFDVLRSIIENENALSKDKDLQRIKELKEKFTSNKKTLQQWANCIFGNENNDDVDDSRSVYQRDCFFDAIIDAVNSKNRMLSSDSITPHGNDPFKEPNPITFVRIASGCKIKFRFRLVDSEGISAKDKLDLFKYILMAFGIGAKTNVGYGRLVRCK